MLTSVWEYVKVMADIGIRTAISGFPTTVTPDTCVIQDTNNSADLNSARTGQNQEMEKNSDYWTEYFRFEKFFDGK